MCLALLEVIHLQMQSVSASTFFHYSYLNVTSMLTYGWEGSLWLHLFQFNGKEFSGESYLPGTYWALNGYLLIIGTTSFAAELYDLLPHTPPRISSLDFSLPLERRRENCCTSSFIGFLVGLCFLDFRGITFFHLHCPGLHDMGQPPIKNGEPSHFSKHWGHELCIRDLIHFIAFITQYSSI